MQLRLTGKQRDLLYRLVDTYVDACAENAENRSDLAMAKRIREQLLYGHCQKRHSLHVSKTKVIGALPTPSEK